MIVKLIASGSRPWELWVKRWGLSYLIDDDVLFDTFANSRVLFKNMRRFGAYVERIRHVVISHDHWDHTGGLWKILECGQGVKVHVPAYANDEFKERIVRAGGNVIEGRTGHRVKEGVHVSTVMVGKHNGKAIAEQALVLEMDQRLIVLSGCGHPGISKMVDQIMLAFDAPVHGVIGGFHFFQGHTDEQIQINADLLKASGVEMVAPTHCTGARAEKIFRKTFAQSCVSLREGQCMIFGNQDS